MATGVGIGPVMVGVATDAAPSRAAPLMAARSAIIDPNMRRVEDKWTGRILRPPSAERRSSRRRGAADYVPVKAVRAPVTDVIVVPASENRRHPAVGSPVFRITGAPSCDTSVDWLKRILRQIVTIRGPESRSFQRANSENGRVSVSPGLRRSALFAGFHVFRIWPEACNEERHERSKGLGRTARRDPRHPDGREKRHVPV